MTSYTATTLGVACLAIGLLWGSASIGVHAGEEGRSVPLGALPRAVVVVPNAGGANNAGGNGLSGQKCSTLNPGCSMCTPGFKSCATCQPGFKLDSGKCFPDCGFGENGNDGNVCSGQLDCGGGCGCNSNADGISSYCTIPTNCQNADCMADADCPSGEKCQATCCGSKKCFTTCP
ncbi:TPA: hypothetical protein ACH3X1_003948 [Trebouxia sp. C0004]